MTMDILTDRRGPVLYVTLNRPAALNALNFPMISGLNAALDRAEQDDGVKAVCLRGAGKAFCAGGDIKAAREQGLAWKRGEADLEDTLDFFREEYALNRRLFHFPKLLISLMDGITMGGGVGVAGPCRIRIVTENTNWAMPEVTIGFFPDIGAGYYLTRAPGKIGTYLGLTGLHVRNAADLMACGFATHYIPSSELERLLITFNSARSEDEIADIITSFHIEPKGVRELDAEWATAYFSGDTLEAIEAGLKTGDDAAQATARLMESKSPTSLAVTLKHLRLSEKDSFDQVSHRDLVLAENFLRGEDMYEGIRAAVVDKDRQPRWGPLPKDPENYFHKF